MIVFADTTPGGFETEAPNQPGATASLIAVAVISATIIFAAIGTTTVLAVEHVEHPEVNYFSHA